MSELNLGVWEGFTNQIKHHLQNDAIQNFMNWPIIQNTMIAGVDLTEFEQLKASKNWELWEPKLGETVLKPNTYNLFPNSSTNNMHHAYSLNVMMEHLGCDLSDFNTIIEFGGGYGNTCRLFKVWGESDYFIYDIPELIDIQKFYLENNGVKNVTFLSGLDKVDELKGKSLFLGLWSISETPVSERNFMLENLKFFDCDSIFIAMGGSFFNENNLDWLNTIIIPKLNELGFKHELIKIGHGVDMFYFVANR